MSSLLPPVVVAGDTGTCLWLWPVIRAPSLAIVMDAATAPIARTTPSPKLTPDCHQCWCLELLPRVLYEFLGEGLVPRHVKFNEAECVTCIINQYYLLINYYYISLLDLLLLIITVFAITLSLHSYYALLHHSLLRIITFFVITLLLHHYCILLHQLLLLIITFSVITLLLHHYCILLHTHYYPLLRHHYYALLYYYYLLLHHYYFIIPNGKKRQ